MNIGENEDLVHGAACHLAMPRSMAEMIAVQKGYLFWV
ncbi:conserved hypothetical protein [Roseovarius sp. EC-HK134]|nr:conserved hypothetical protein [Roseovarius sp. EC-HK134]VVT32673.1 conserved hypothetical protein [Roseovarius sp. EC-SD190]